MANLHLVTGYAGEEHITSMDAGSYNAAVLGIGEYVLARGQQFAAEIITNNQVRIYDGDLQMQGRHVTLQADSYVDLYFDNGTSGYYRNDLIVAQYAKDSSTDVEECNLVVIKGTPSDSEATDPDYTTGDILNDGALENDMLLYRVSFDGLTMNEPEALFTVMPAISDVNNLICAEGPGTHNCIYRGKYLGTEITDDQWTEIENGTFNDLYIGDYWTIDGVNWRIAAFDYYYMCGDTFCTTHHIVIVPDTYVLTSQQMNSSNTTSGGYVGSAMYTDVLPDALEIVESAFGSSHILSHRVYLTNAITSGYPSAGSWYDSQIELMNELMVYGSHIYAPANYLGSTIPNKYTVEKSQLPLFQCRPDLIGIRTAWWLRDVVSSASFASVGGNGNANYLYASYSYGVRPAFCIS